MAELQRVQTWAEALIRLHLDDSWSFAFDHAKRRAGLTDYQAKRISVSRYLAAKYEDDEIHQVLLHEIAHAIAGHADGHGARWRRTAEELGYTGGRLHRGESATELAPWIGHCPAGHEHYRFRKPTRPSSCAQCSRSYDERHRIVWRRNEA